MDARKAVGRLQAALGVQTLAALARELEISPTAIHGAISRGSIPERWLYLVAHQSGCRVEWLRTGEGARYESVAAEALSVYVTEQLKKDSRFRRLASSWRKLSKEEQLTIFQCAEALQTGDEQVRSHLINQMEIVGRAIETRQKRRPKKETG